MIPFYILFIFVFLIQSIHAYPLASPQEQQSILIQLNDHSKLQDTIQNVIDFYESIVDTSLNTDSEELLLNLVHLPKQELNRVLKTQIEFLDLNEVPDKSLYKVSGIIGGHIQEMNSYIYDLIEPLIQQQQWEFIKSEDLISFLSIFHGNMAKLLLDEIQQYQLIEKIKRDIQPLTSKTRSSWIRKLFTRLSQEASEKEDEEGEEETSSVLKGDFLKQYLSELRTNLLMEFHIQFYDFYTRIQLELF